MDEKRTRQTLDALADLFLTGTDAGDADPASASTLDGPDPIRLPPKVHVPPSPTPPPPRSTQPPRDPERESPSTPTPPTFKLHPAAHDADRPTTETTAWKDDATDTASDHPAAEPAHDRDLSSAGSASWLTAPPRVEAVVMANLPGFSGPWLTQYAARLARDAGPVLLLHLGDEMIDAELVAPHAAPPIAPDLPRTDSLEVMIHALDQLDDRVATVLVHSLTHDARQRLIRTAGLTRWTVLSGADDAALASCAEQMRAIHHPDGDVEIGLMVMGSDQPDAAAAVRKINEQNDGARRQRVELVGWQKQMMPVRQHVLGQFVDLDEGWRVVEAMISSMPMVRGRDDEPMAWSAQRAAPVEHDPAAAIPESGPINEGESSDDPPLRDEPMSPSDRQVIRSAARDFVDRLEDDTPPPFGRSDSTESASERERDPTPPEQPAVDAAPPPPPEPPAPEPEPAATPESATVSLASFIPGSIALQATCPRQPDAQLGLDESGRLHLMRRHQKDHEPMRLAIMDLIEARSWVIEHLELLAMTQRQCTFDREASPKLHLFTDDAATAAGLVNRLSDQVELHVLSEVHVDQAAAWYHARLT